MWENTLRKIPSLTIHETLWQSQNPNAETSTAGPEAPPQQVAPANKQGVNSILESFKKVETLYKQSLQIPKSCSFFILL